MKCTKCHQTITPDIPCLCVSPFEDAGYTRVPPKKEREQKRKEYGAEKAKRGIDQIKNMLEE